jgi:hypothetical protein
MVNKPKIITVLARLWLALGIIFIINVFFFTGFLIYAILSDGSNDPGLYRACLIWTLIFIIILLLFSILSFIQWGFLSNLKKSTIKRSLILSFVTLLIWVGPTIYFVYAIHSSTVSLWYILPFSLCSILFVDIFIIAISVSSIVKEFIKT